ncbi:MAG: DJ-1/PfpI family protein [Bacteroidia bacterium]|nr:DJ-1/PfpI family protein [Bacteroidia bacterium]
MLNVAILIYDGVYVLDFTGPLEVFYDSYSQDGKHLFNVYTVSAKEELKAHSGLKITPDYSINNCPKPDIFIVPGGDLGLLKDQPKLKDWLVNTAKESKTLISVCTGAFILADAGLLDNLNITTWHGALENLKKLVPTANVMKGVRYTDNGKVVTTAGVSAGIDGSLFVVSKYFGKEVADETAKYMDYEYWK